MIGAIAGDIIGSRFEGGLPRNRNFPLFTGESRITDDTVLITSVMRKFLDEDTYEECLREGYGRKPGAGFGLFFSLWAVTGSPHPYRSVGNGAAVRACPIGMVYPTLLRTLDEARASAVVTHNTDQAIRAAQAVAGAVHLARRGASRDTIRSFAEDIFGYHASRPLRSYRSSASKGCSCRDTVPAAFASFLHSRDFEGCIRNAVRSGSDTDTIAAMAGAIAEAFYGSVPPKIASEVRSRLAAEGLLGTVDEFYLAVREGAFLERDGRPLIDRSTGELNEHPFQALLASVFSKPILKLREGTLYACPRKQEKRYEKQVHPRLQHDEGVTPTYDIMRSSEELLSFGWSSGMPCSWSLGLWIHSVGPRTHYFFLNGDVDPTDFASRQILARLEGKPTARLLFESLRAILHRNGELVGHGIFGSLPTATVNHRPDLIDGDSLRQLYREWMNHAAGTAGIASWTDLTSDLDITLPEALGQMKEVGGPLAWEALRGLKEKALNPSEKQEILDRFFEATYRRAPVEGTSDGRIPRGR